jgi:hypothetical protein
MEAELRSAGQPSALFLRVTCLFCNHAAGDAIAGIAGRICLHVIGFGMDHQRGSPVAED